MRTKFLWVGLTITVIAVIFMGLYILYLKDLNKNQVSKATPQISPVSLSGEKLLTEINNYRTINGVKEIKLDMRLCNDLVERWKAIYPTHVHDGFDEFLAKQIKAEKLPKEQYRYAELFAFGDSEKNLIEKWDTSPGHKTALLNPQFENGCTYATQDLWIILMRRLP